MSERLTITPLGAIHWRAECRGLDVTRPLSDNQFEQLYHAVLRHQVVFLREQAITPQQQRALALRFGDSAYPPPSIRMRKVRRPAGGDSGGEAAAGKPGAIRCGASGIAAYEAALRTIPDAAERAEGGARLQKIIPGIQVSQKQRGTSALAGGGCETSSAAAPGGADPSGDGQAGAVRERRVHHAHCGRVRERE
ncbi:hypothetical protein L1887_60437 [Cichorium endivia]|nr:hypothetical protein L1887_60437 [Cichorium endivia]